MVIPAGKLAILVSMIEKYSVHIPKSSTEYYIYSTFSGIKFTKSK